MYRERFETHGNLVPGLGIPVKAEFLSEGPPGFAALLASGTIVLLDTRVVVSHGSSDLVQRSDLLLIRVDLSCWTEACVD